MKLSALFFGVLLLLAACAGHRVDPHSEEALLARVKAYWDLRLRGAGPQERLAYERCGLKPACREAFLRGGGKAQSVTYHSYEILGVERPDENTALVKIRVRFTVPPVLGRSFEQEASFTDKWVFVEGDWYHVIRGFGAEW